MLLIGTAFASTANLREDTFPVHEKVSVVVEIRDLAGRLVRRIHAGEGTVAHYDHLWDGTDTAGGLVAPGVYLCQVSVEMDAAKDAQIQALHVAY